MRVTVLSCRPRRAERLTEIVERGDRSGAEDAEFERPRRRVELRARAAEPRRRMGDQRLRPKRPKVLRRLEDEPRQGARLALAERAARRILDLDAPTRQFSRHAARDRGIRRDQGGGLARRLEHFAHRDRERERLLGLVVGDDDGNVFKRGGDGRR